MCKNRFCIHAKHTRQNMFSLRHSNWGKIHTFKNHSYLWLISMVILSVKYSHSPGCNNVNGVTFSDVDLCMDLREANYFTIYCYFISVFNLTGSLSFISYPFVNVAISNLIVFCTHTHFLSFILRLIASVKTRKKTTGRRKKISLSLCHSLCLSRHLTHSLSMLLPLPYISHKELSPTHTCMKTLEFEWGQSVYTSLL